MSSPPNLLNIARKYVEPHVASNVRYLASSMRTNSLLTPCVFNENELLTHTLQARCGTFTLLQFLTPNP